MPVERSDLAHHVDVPARDVVLEPHHLAGDEQERQHHRRSRRRWRRPRSRAGRSSCASRGAPTSRSRTTRRCGPRARAASRGRRGAARAPRSAARPSPIRSSRARARRRSGAAKPGRRAVAQRREVGDQADVPEDERDREVGADREDVPEQRRAEVHPERAARVGVREHPVREPRPAHVDQREEPGAHHGEDRHRLGRAVDRGAPALPEEEQHRREISVPAWPMPTQNTKFVMSKAQPTVRLRPQTPMPVMKR